MNTQIQVNSVSEERAWFYSTFESALKSEVEKVGGQVDTFYSKNNPGVVQAFSVKFSDSPVATTIYPEPLCRLWQEGLSIPSLVDSVMRSARHEKLLDFSDYVLRHENAATHLKASLVKVEGAENWLKTVPLFSKLAHWYEEKLVKKADQINEYAKWGLFLLVAIPLPGTGAWTGVLVATFLNMKMRQALPMIFLGVLAAGIVMVIGSYGLFGAIRLF